MRRAIVLLAVAGVLATMLVLGGDGPAGGPHRAARLHDRGTSAYITPCHQAKLGALCVLRRKLAEASRKEMKT
jgi:hypothetical protein